MEDGLDVDESEIEEGERIAHYGATRVDVDDRDSFRKASEVTLAHLRRLRVLSLLVPIVPFAVLALAALVLNVWLGLVVGLTIVCGILFTLVEALGAMRRLAMAGTAVSQSTHLELWELASTIADRVGVSLPPLLIFPDDSVNAFAALYGVKKPFLVLHSGLLESFVKEEVEAVLAHELCHVKQRDLVLFLLLVGARPSGTVLLNRRTGFVAGLDHVVGDLFRWYFTLTLYPLRVCVERMADINAALALGSIGPLHLVLSRFVREEYASHAHLHQWKTDHVGVAVRQSDLLLLLGSWRLPIVPFDVVEPYDFLKESTASGGEFFVLSENDAARGAVGHSGALDSDEDSVVLDESVPVIPLRIKDIFDQAPERETGGGDGVERPRKTFFDV